MISAGRLDDEGYTGSIQNGVMKFNKGSLIVGRAWKINSLYLMHIRICRVEGMLQPEMLVSCGTRDCVT